MFLSYDRDDTDRAPARRRPREGGAFRLEQPAAVRSDLEEALSFAAARVLGCAIEESSEKNGRLSDKSRRIYLNACATLAEIGWDPRPVIPMLREVLREAPKFRPAWARVLVAQANAVSWLSAGGESVETARAQLRSDIARARAVDPSTSVCCLAGTHLTPSR